MFKQKRWQDMTGKQKMLVVLAGAIQLALLSVTLWDIRHRPASEIKGSKKLWTAVAFVNYIGPLAYFAFGRKRTHTIDTTIQSY